MIASTQNNENHETTAQQQQFRNRMRTSFPHARKRLLPAVVLSVLLPLIFTGAAFSDSESDQDEPTASPLIGHWILTVPSADGLQNPELAIYQKGSTLKGWVKGPRGKMRLKKVTAEGDQFTFVQIVPIPNSTMKLTFEGTVRGDHLQGVMSSKRLPNLPFKGVRKLPED